MINKSYEILQIVPTSGKWYALYETSAKGDPVEVMRCEVVCFGLVRYIEKGLTAIRAFVYTEDGTVGTAESSGDYINTVPEDELNSEWIKQDIRIHKEVKDEDDEDELELVEA